MGVHAPALGPQRPGDPHSPDTQMKSPDRAGGPGRGPPSEDSEDPGAADRPGASCGYSGRLASTTFVNDAPSTSKMKDGLWSDLDLSWVASE